MSEANNLRNGVQLHQLLKHAVVEEGRIRLFVYSRFLSGILKRATNAA